ncbi:hypothetical protein BW899_28730 [Bacillus mycoides]|nr:hypothetical protein BW899_28730 [Bacillus mycoides]QWG76106.1 hypothetical protein EXW63_27835 [Bacillus mycoides]QWH26492.1 hypothetical protein EXW50_28255 [Bacillus mycoides]
MQQLINDSERRLSNLKRVRNGFLRIDIDEYRDGVNKQIVILDQVVMRLNWIIRGSVANIF